RPRAVPAPAAGRRQPREWPDLLARVLPRAAGRTDLRGTGRPGAAAARTAAVLLAGSDRPAAGPDRFPPPGSGGPIADAGLRSGRRRTWAGTIAGQPPDCDGQPGIGSLPRPGRNCRPAIAPCPVRYGVR